MSDAVSRGATVAVGGVAPGGPGQFYPATVLADVPADARILKEEVFGPVAPITGFDTEEEGVAAANDTEYGLAAYIYTQALDRALRVAEGSSPAWSASTVASSPTRPPRSAASSSPASDARAARKASRSTSTPNTSR